MRLLRSETGGEFSLREYLGDVPQYAILSHTWGAEHDEVTFRDFAEGTAKNKRGYRKLTFCGQQAANDGLEFFWIDTCCIDKSSSAELSEAINSMFRWYRDAAICYAYLSDVSISGSAKIDQSFQKSRWFSRGWTLQELLAPRRVDFFSMEGERIGDKCSMVQTIHTITGIPIEALEGSPLSQFDVNERISWAKQRETTRPEDAAYCLLGIFDIYMPLLYGEGQKSAFYRLQKEIKESLESGMSVEIREGFGTAVPAFDVVKISDDKGKANDGLYVRSWDLDVVIRGILSNMHETANAEKPMGPRLDGDPEAHDGALASMLGSLEDNLKNKNKASFSALVGDDFNDISRHIRKVGEQVKIFQNASDTLLDPYSLTNPAPQLLQHLTELEAYTRDQRMQDPIRSTSIQLLLHLNRRVRLESQNIINDWLDVTKFSNQHDVTQYYDKQVSTRLEGTCDWFLSHLAYREWISEDHLEKAARILWVCAPAGHGKTVLCAKLIEHLKGMQSFPVAYFFASPHAQSGGEPTFILRSWIAQTAQLDSGVLRLLLRYSEAGKRASDSAVWSVFESIVSEKSNYVFILDGFDEYDRLEDARTEFLQKLKGATKRTGVRVLITSRDETDIKAELSPIVVQDGGHTMTQCRISDKDLQHDIARFSQSVVDKKLPNKDDRLRQDLAGQLAEKCEGMFLWIKMQQDQLRGGKNAKQLQKIVQNMPIGLDKTYERNWKIIQSHPLEEQNRALAILRWTTFALRPLTITEITEALIVEPNDSGTILQFDELPDSIDDEYINSEVIDICGALVEVRTKESGDGIGSKTVHLIHSSVREFLLTSLSHISANTFDHDLKYGHTRTHTEQHEHLATICLSYLNCDDVWQRRITHEMSGFRRSFTSYAARYWNSHMTAAGKNNVNLVSLAMNFFRSKNENFDHWRRYIESSDATADSRDTATPLYYAALLDLPAVMEHIWTEDPSQLNMLGGEYGTPLQATCFKGHETAFGLLINWGADVNVEGGKFGVAIIAAIAGRHKSIVKALVGMGINHTLRDSMGRTPLYTAAMEGDSEVVGWLLEANAEPSIPDQYGWTPLNIAAYKGYLEVAKLLLKNKNNADSAVPDKDGWTPLNTAAGEGHLEVVKLLLEKNADFTVPNNNGWTPLNIAAYHGYLEVVRLLLEKNADFTVPNNNGWTPLNTAASEGHLEVVNLLLEKNADFTVPNNNGWTPLNIAAYSGHLEVVRLLLEKNADFTVPSNDGWTPLNIAAYHGHLEIVRLLLRKNADFTVPNNGGGTALFQAAYSGHLEVVRLLLEKNADFTVLNNSGETPLFVAAYNGHLEVVKLLLEKNADFTVLNNNSETPLFAAAYSGHLNVVKLLLEENADFTIANNGGWTPLIVAASEGHLEVVKLLLAAGSDVDCRNHLYGSFLNLLAFKGYTDLLRLAYEQYNANLHVVDFHGRTLLQLAARGGHFDTFQYLISLDVDSITNDASGGGLLRYASSGGSIQILDAVLSIKSEPSSIRNHWSPLHWACRAGNCEVVERLIQEGVQGDCVPVLQPEGQWSPASIAIFHGNKEMLEKLSATCKSLLIDESDATKPHGERHGGAWCNGCLHSSRAFFSQLLDCNYEPVVAEEMFAEFKHATIFDASRVHVDECSKANEHDIYSSDDVCDAASIWPQELLRLIPSNRAAFEGTTDVGPDRSDWLEADSLPRP
ncbi:hypothetical protein N0V90_013224 [Kalmusia sp. IMI 367209]|nr:hypothetical protein N0V90_013224 [Kalmusia sp. IMI 367209]